MSSIRRFLGWSMVGFSLLLYLFTVVCFARQPDRFAAFTVMPIWLWGGLGIFIAIAAGYLIRAKSPWILAAVWIVTLLLSADEVRSIRHFGNEAPLPGRATSFDSKPVIRVITANNAMAEFGDPTDEIAAWKPDIVLLQQTGPATTIELAKKLYGASGNFRIKNDNGIASRWKIVAEQLNPLLRSQQVTVELPDRSKIEVVNLHLVTATTDLRFWKTEAWRTHTHNRQVRRDQLSLTLQALGHTPRFPDIPTILGGDFNAPATDVIFRAFDENFTDAFTAAGTGLGNTFHRRLPILRIDHVYSTKHLVPVRCRVVESRHSDHRFVVADYVWR
jgi:endonuclease/exonuclease/phosphatase (EEP) superfamily protein YafD